jgi:hypothetical protein
MSDEDYDVREKTIRAHVRAERAKNPDFVMFAKNKGQPGVEGSAPEDAAPERPETPRNVSRIIVLFYAFSFYIFYCIITLSFFL